VVKQILHEHSDKLDEIELPIKREISDIWDFNKDGKVDFDDLLILAQNYGKPGFEGGDANADGKVDFDDLLLLAQRYNSSSSSTK
jgi:Ca2+-binding EF-hand superfamily protein